MNRPLGGSRLTRRTIRFYLTTSQLIDYAKFVNVEISTTDGKKKRVIADEIIKELERRGFF